MQNRKNRFVPIIILLFLLIVGSVIVYSTMNEQRKTLFKEALLNPFGFDINKPSIETITEPISSLAPEEALKLSNEDTLNEKNFYIAKYKNKISHNTLVNAIGYSTENNVYMVENEYYVDLTDNIYYYIDNEKWHKKQNDIEVKFDINDYIIPSDATYKGDTILDGAQCFIFETNDKTFYIKKSTNQLGFVKFINDNTEYYLQISHKEIKIRDEIKEKALD